MAGRLNVNPYRRQDGLAYTAPGRTFDWKYPPDGAGRRAAAFSGLRDAFGPVASKFGALGDAVTALQRTLTGVTDGTSQSDYALVDAEGGPADADEEEEGH